MTKKERTEVSLLVIDGVLLLERVSHRELERRVNVPESTGDDAAPLLVLGLHADLLPARLGELLLLLLLVLLCLFLLGGCGSLKSVR